MSTVRSWFRSVVRGSGNPSSGTAVDRGQANKPIQVLLASVRTDDYERLRTLLKDTKWSVAQALTWGEVSGFCSCEGDPVVLVDRHFQGADWRFTVSSLLNLSAKCCLILVSDVSDPYLWNELVRYGGFDVLARPFERSEVLRILAFAQRHRNPHWPPLHSENEGSPA